MKRALETFFAGDVQVPAGALVSDDDTIVEGREHMFADHDDEGAPPSKRRTQKARATA